MTTVTGHIEQISGREAMRFKSLQNIALMLARVSGGQFLGMTGSWPRGLSTDFKATQACYRQNRLDRVNTAETCQSARFSGNSFHLL
jgi:hypothetical protein